MAKWFCKDTSNPEGGKFVEATSVEEACQNFVLSEFTPDAAPRISAERVNPAELFDVALTNEPKAVATRV